MKARDFFRRVRLCLAGWKLRCCGCGAEVKLRVTNLGRTLDISGPDVQGWTFTSERGWHCPTCRETLGS